MGPEYTQITRASRMPQVSDFAATAWRAAKDDYERRMAPIEQRISQKLRELFGGCACAEQLGW